MKTKSIVMKAGLIGLGVFLLQACEQQAPPDSETLSVDSAAAPVTAQMADKVNDIADRYYDSTLSRTPELAYFSGVELERHDGLEDNSPAARKAAEEFADALLDELEAIDASELKGRTEWITHAYLLQQLKSHAALRICHAADEMSRP